MAGGAPQVPEPSGSPSRKVLKDRVLKIVTASADSRVEGAYLDPWPYARHVTTPHNPPEPQSNEIEEPIALRYEGPGHEGEMSARELATVLASLTDFVQAVSHDLGTPVAPTVKVKAFNEGSFLIDAVLEFIRQTTSHPGVTTAGVATAVGAAFRFYWKNMRRVPIDVHHAPDRGIVRVKWLDGEISELSEREWRFYQNKRAKRAMRGLVLPLRSGATRMELSAGGEVVADVPAADAPLFELPQEQEETVRRFEVWAEPDTVSFDPGRKWRLSSRELGSFTATIEDPTFREAVDAGRTTIGKTDVFRLAMRQEVSEVDGAMKTQNYVERVIDHRRGAEQDVLPPEGS